MGKCVEKKIQGPVPGAEKGKRWKRVDGWLIGTLGHRKKSQASLGVKMFPEASATVRKEKK